MPGVQPMKPPRITIGVYGPKGRTVRVLLSRDESDVIVQHFVNGKRQILRSYPNTGSNRKVAKEWAKTYALERDTPRSSETTVRALWDAYKASPAFTTLRPRSQWLYESRWKKWELFYGAHVIAEDATVHDFDRLRAALTIAPNQVRAIITVVKLVYRWGETRDLLSRNRIAAYRFTFAKEERPVPVPEYTPEEFDKILATLKADEDWRPWALLVLIGHQGVRVKAALHLRWDDIGNGVITWPARYDKTGETWSQPIRQDTQAALDIAFGKRPKVYTPWVFYGRQPNHPYRVQSLWYRLTEAEKAAGIKHRPWRAMHGLRRMVVGDAFGVTGSLETAGEFVNQKDIDTARGYLRDRGRRKETADQLDRHATVTDGTFKNDDDLATVDVLGSSERATGRNRTDDHPASGTPSQSLKRAKASSKATPSKRHNPRTRGET